MLVAKILAPYCYGGFLMGSCLWEGFGCDGEGGWWGWGISFLGGVLWELEEGLDPQQDGAMAVLLGPDSEALGGREPPADLCDPGEW